MVNEKGVFFKKFFYNILKVFGALLTVSGFGSFFYILREEVLQKNIKSVPAGAYWISISIGLLGLVIFCLSNKQFDKSFRNPDDDYYSKKKLIAPVMIFIIITIWYFYVCYY